MPARRSLCATVSLPGDWAAPCIGRRCCQSSALLLKAGLGEMSTLLLGGQRARPVRLLEAGFTFRFNDLQSALDNLSSRL